MNADVIVTVHGRDHTDFGRKVEAIDAIARAPQEMPPGPTVPPVILPPIETPVPVPPKPYFDVGDGSGKPGDTVEISVEGGSVGAVSGFHIGGGVGRIPDEPRTGYGNFQAVGVTLGKYLHDYLLAQGAITVDDQGKETAHYWSIFQFVQHEPHRPFPEEWWEYALGFFSISQERSIPPIPIPNGTELFTLQVKILALTDPGVYDLTCEDEHYWVHSRPRRRDFMYTNERQGYTKIETFGGKLTVTG